MTTFQQPHQSVDDQTNIGHADKIDQIGDRVKTAGGDFVAGNKIVNYIESEQPASETKDKAQQEADWQRGVQQYYDNLYHIVGYVRVLGKQKTEPLENIFTDVNILDKPLAERRYQLGEMKGVWHGRRFTYGHIERYAASHAFKNYQRMFILGKPGAGKTTFMKWTALQAIKGKIDKFPIFVTLKVMSDDNPSLRTSEQVIDFIIRRVVQRIPEPREFVTRLLQRGKAIVLFDGLDEVNIEGERRSNLINALNQFVITFSESQILITCRVAATDFSFVRFQYVEMADFSDLQIKAFVNRWFEHDPEKRDQCREQLTGDSANAMLQELARVPLLLTLLCLVYEERNEFPPNRAEIYEEATRALLSKWDASRNIRRDSSYRALTLRRKGQLLASVAATTFQEGVFFIAKHKLVKLIEAYLQGVPDIEDANGELVLNEIAAQHGLLVERARNIYSFSHLTLQEYFCARYIVENEARGSLTGLLENVGEDHWKEVFLLIGGMLDDATKFAFAYRNKLWRMVKNERELIKLIRWLVVKQKLVNDLYRESAIRAFYIYTLDLNLDRSLALSLTRSRALTPALALALDPNLNPAHAHAHTLGLDPTRALTLAFDRDFTSDRNRPLALDLSLTRVLDRQPSPALNRALERSLRMNLESLHQKLVKLQNKIPDAKDGLEAWRSWAEQLRQVMIEERHIGHKWVWTEENLAVLNRYMAGNLVLVESLKLAYLPPQVREEILDSLLRPLD